jgi:hypothetical protein
MAHMSPTRDPERLALDAKLKPYASATFTKAQADEVCNILDTHYNDMKLQAHKNLMDCKNLEEFNVWLKGLPPTVAGSDHVLFRKCWATYRNEELYFFQKWLSPYS